MKSVVLKTLATALLAAIPALPPLAISLVAWSSTSDGPLVKMLSRVGVGAEAEKDVAGVVNVHVVVHHDEAFGEQHLAHAPKPEQRTGQAPTASV